MIGSRDNRNRFRPILIEMSEDELRETAEWLEMIDPQDRATQDWRALADELAPVPVDEAV